MMMMMMMSTLDMNSLRQVKRYTDMNSAICGYPTSRMEKQGLYDQ